MARWIDKRALFYALMMGVCGVIGYIIRGEVIDWNWIGGAIVATGFGTHYAFRIARYIDGLENRVRYLEQMTGHRAPDDE